MPAPSIPPLFAMRAPQEQRDSTTVQVLGMDVSSSPSYARTHCNASDGSLTSGTSTPQMQGDYAVTRNYIPSHSSTASRLNKQSSFSTGTSHSPASSEAHEELASLSSRSASQYDSSTFRLAGPSETTSRRSHLNHSNRVLSHKDSFGGSYGMGSGAELSYEPIDEASASPRLARSQKPATSSHDDQPLESHLRTASFPHLHALRSTQQLGSSQSTDGSGGSDLTEPVEVLGRSSAFANLPTSDSLAPRHSTLTTSRSRSALSAASDAASSCDKEVADTTFAAKFDHSVSLEPAGRSDACLEKSLGLPTSAIAESSPRSPSISLASKSSERIRDEVTTSAASFAPPSRSTAPLDDTESQLTMQSKHHSSVAPIQASQKKDYHDTDDRDKTTTSSSKRPSSSRARESAAHSGSARADANSSTARPLKSSQRTLPQLPSASGVLPAPPPAMYWSKAPVHGSIPRRSFRAHTANLCDEVLWLFGGCDNRGCFRDLWCFDTETMCWSKPKVTGDIPPARRAHSATMVNKRLYVFAGGDGPHYFNDLYIFDTVSLRWTKPEVGGTAPSPRRAHTCNYYEGQLIVFGGGNGVGALNDVHTLDVNDLSRLEWRKVQCSGKVPIGRGYHTSNLVDGKLIVIGGSDGHMSFNDIHILRLDTRTWYQVKTDEVHNRLGHTATQVGSYLFIFGGHDSKTYTSELLTLNLVNLQWEPRKVCGKRPQGRGYHQAWLRDSRLFVHGGFDGKDIFDDLHFLDLAACAYLPQITSFSVELDDEE